MRVCEYPDCTKPSWTPSSIWCSGHWTQVYRGQELRPLRSRRPRTDTQCAVEGCPTPRVGSYCSKHGARIQRHGDPTVFIPHVERDLPRGPQPGQWIEQPTYSTVHHRLVRVRGRAADRVCACGAPARDWAYTGPRTPGERFPFGSIDQYEAMCRACHQRLDRAAIRDGAA